MDGLNLSRGSATIVILSQKKQFRVGDEIGIIYHGTDISGDFQASLCQQLANINSDYMFKSGDYDQC